MGSDSTAVATDITDRTPCGHLVPDKVRAARCEMPGVATLGELGETFKVLNHPMRLKITHALFRNELGIDDWRSGLLPEEKVSAVAELRRQHGAVAMVGDGVNDAPALAAADVGIAMGAAGSDAALETADVALMADDVGKLPYLFRLSHRSRRVIRQNVSLSIVVKLALVAGVVPGAVSLIVAVLLGDVGTSLLVTGNATRLAAAGRD